MNIIDQLATDWINGTTGKNKVIIDLMVASEIPYSRCKDLLKAARKRLVSIQMQNELADEQDDADNAKHEREYRKGASL